MRFRPVNERKGGKDGNATARGGKRKKVTLRWMLHEIRRRSDLVKEKERCGETEGETIVRRCDDDAQLLHDVERLPVDAARRVEPNCHERVGRRVYVLHLRQLARVRLRELRRS